MSSSFEKSVKGATKIKAAPPKTKYIEHILVATHVGEHGVAEVFRALQMRLRDSTWTVVFKSLITIHLMIREGKAEVTLAYLAKHRNMLAISTFTDAQTQGRNIRHYASYLAERARAYRDTKRDWARGKDSRLESLSVDKGLLRETEVVQHQVTALLKCDVMDHDPENEVTLMVFRLLVLDMLALFQALNQGLVNILGHFFEMSKTDAERALKIYRNFTKQMEYIVQYLDVARQYEHVTRVEVQALKHVPVHLESQLDDYLRDADFEINRRQYLAELDAKKKSGGSATSTSAVARFKTDGGSAPGSRSKPASTINGGSSSQQQSSKPQANKGPDPDLIDFFDSIEQNQTPMQGQATAQQPQMTGMPYQQTGFQQPMMTGYPMNGIAAQATGFSGTNPFQQQAFGAAPQPLQTNFTGAGFGGFTPQPAFQPGSLGTIPQNTVATFQQTSPTGLQPMQTGAQTTNPFRASLIVQQQTGPMSIPAQNTSMSAPTSPALTRSATNPFARPSTASQPFSPSLATTQEAPIAAPLKPMATGTNPFAKMTTQAQSPPPEASQAPLVPQPTGSTNPFRQGNFVNHNTGVGWQHNQQRIGGGFDEVQTIPVFPRPGHQTPWQ